MELKIEYLNKEDLRPYANNAKVHTAEQVEQIKKSIEEFGFNDPIAIWHDNEIIEGHGRLLAVMEMDDIKTVPVIRLDDLTDEQRRAYMLVHNKLTMNTDFEFDVLNLELDGIVEIDMSLFGFEADSDDHYEEEKEHKGALAEKFLVPPFSVIQTMRQDWLDRKRKWVDFGIRSELGRGGATYFQCQERLADNGKDLTEDRDGIAVRK